MYSLVEGRRGEKGKDFLQWSPVCVISINIFLSGPRTQARDILLFLFEMKKWLYLGHWTKLHNCYHPFYLVIQL